MTDPVTLDGEGAIGVFDEKRAENAVRELLIAVGEDPDREGLRETPARVARAYKEIFAGLWQKPEDVLTTTFDLGHDEMVLVKDIEVLSNCEHHLVPFVGVAHVGYIPSADGKITGLSKLARLVDVYARRPQVQERLTTQVADSLMEILEPRGSSSSLSASTCACRCGGCGSPVPRPSPRLFVVSCGTRRLVMKR